MIDRSLPQELRELGARANLSKAPTTAERDTWMQLSHEFLASFADQEVNENEQKHRTLKGQRRKARQFLQALDHGLLTSTGVGLKHFVPDPLAADTQLDINQPGPLNILSLSIDQGSVGWAASWYAMLHLKAALVLHIDPSHRCHNDLQLAYKASGLWGHMVLTSILYNFSYGPFDGAAWLEQSKTAAEEFAAHGGPQDELFQSYVGAIARDMGLEDDIGSEGFCENIFSHFVEAECFSKKGPQVKLSRWMSWLDAAAYHDKFWHCRLVAFIYWGIIQGWASKGQRCGIIKPLQVNASIADDAPKVPVPQGDKEAAELRQKCSNTMHVCAQVYSDPVCQQKGRICVRLSAPTRLWHGTQNKHNRSPDSCKEEAYKAAMGIGWMGALAETAQMLKDAGALEFCGFTTNYGTTSLKALDLKHPLVAEEDEMARLFSSLATNILRFRTRGMLFNWACYPGLLVKLLGPTDVQKKTLATMKEHWGAWTEATAHAAQDAWWRRRLERSCFNQMVVIYAFRLASLVAFEYVPPALESIIRNSFETIGQTKLIEDTFHDQRDAETRGQPSKSMSCRRKFQVCVASGVLNQKHKFDAVAYGDYTGPLDGIDLHNSLFRPDKVAGCTVDVKGITEAATWHNPSALSSQAISADLFLMRSCALTGEWDAGSQAWRSTAVPEGTIMKHKMCEEWMLSLGHVQGVAVLLWPLEEVALTVAGKTCYIPAAAGIDDLEWGVILDWADWHALPCEWVSPLHLWKLNGHRRPGCTAIAALKVDDEMPLLRYCALQGFFRTDLTHLTKLLHEQGGTSASRALHHVLTALVELIIPDIQPETLLGILQRRLPKASAYMDLLQSAEVQEAMGEEEAEAVNRLKEQEGHQDAANNSLRAEVHRLAAKVRAARQAPSSSSGAELVAPKRRKKCQARLVKQVPPGTDDLTEEQVQDLLPDGPCRMHKDFMNNRWRGYYGKEQSRSRSWVRKSGRDSCLDVLRFLWDCHTSATGEACWVTGLYG